MKNKTKIMIGVLIILGVLIIGGYLIYQGVYGDWSFDSCLDECRHRGYEYGDCKWQSEVREDYEEIGSCLIKDSEHCGVEGQCNCYCFNEPLVGGCAGVHMDYWQECCDNWAEENGIFHVACVGEWTIEDNQCVWECSSDFF